EQGDMAVELPVPGQIERGIGRDARRQVAVAGAQRLIGVLPELRGGGDRGETQLDALLDTPVHASLQQVTRRIRRDLADLAGNHAGGEARVEQTGADKSLQMLAAIGQRRVRQEIIVELALET